jgi:predicted RNA-binding Zn ribbon-like protein
MRSVTAQASDPRPLAGEPLALDLLNTQWLASGTPVDLLATQDGTRAWLAAAGLAAPPAPETQQALIAARQAIRDVLAQPSGGGRRVGVGAERGGGTSRARGREKQSGTEALGRLNGVLQHGRLRLSIGPSLRPARRLEVDDPAWEPAVMAAANLLELLDQAPERIRSCQHPACVLWFYDTTRNATRRWCSMATCGNRAKAQRHYQRARQPPA